MSKSNIQHTIMFFLGGLVCVCFACALVRSLPPAHLYLSQNQLARHGVINKYDPQVAEQTIPVSRHRAIHSDGPLNR